MRSLEARLRLELGSRKTHDLRVEDCLPAIWVPRGNPELQSRLREAERATQLALREAAARRSVVNAGCGVVRSRPLGAPQCTLGREALSRTVTKLLRHTAVKQGLTVRADGYVRVAEILALDRLFGVTEASLLEIVDIDAKRRFSVLDEDGAFFMRANQGHSMACVKEDQLLTPILDATEVPVCIHGTYEKAFPEIMASALDSMSRNAIQMAVGLPEDTSVTSGVRSNVEVLIYIDVARSISLGIKFFRSPNNVICSPGPIPPSCFAYVARRTDSAPLLAPSFGC